MATNRVVTSCLDDNGAGTLRGVIATLAQSGDTVDLSGLSCPGSKITLVTGGSQIQISQTSLTIKGPANSVLTIDGSALAEGSTYNYSNIFRHAGSGTLSVQDLALTGGHQKHRLIDSMGGCIESLGNVSLTGVTVASCTNYSRYGTAKGGAVYAKGNLTLSHATIVGNAESGNACRGGGVYAHGNLTLSHSTVSGNAANCYNAANGGGVYAAGTLIAQYSVISSNAASSVNAGAGGGGALAKGSLTLQASVLAANSLAGATTVGGGARVYGNFLGTYSTIANNVAYGPGFGGGLNLGGTINTVVSSTISGNVSQGGFGGIDVFSAGAVGSSFQMRNSTVSGNIAAGNAGGIYVDSRTTKFYNSTIAFNQASSAPGVQLSSFSAALDATLQSNLMSNNTAGGSSEEDLSKTGNNALTINGGNVAQPANNLVRVSFLNNLPSDTLSGYCPHLGQLRDNGGLAMTHALLSGSKAIDAGNNLFLLFFDQRGSALTNGSIDYPRVSGSSNLPDIGAYEVQQEDVVFNVDFEGCPPLPF